MKVTLDIGGVIEYLLLGWTPISEDEAVFIGDSRVAYLSEKDPSHVFIIAAKWHDAAYTKGQSIQDEWPRWKVDQEFLKKMLNLASGNYELERDALILYLAVRLYGARKWAGTIPDDDGYWATKRNKK